MTAHAPNFDFWTGCREIKRCEESRRTLKNPFASRLAEFSITLKLLRITDQWCNLGEIEIFWRYFYCLWPENQKMGSVLMPIEDLISSASFHTSSDNCERNTQKRNSNYKDYKKETIGTLMWLYWGDLVKLAWWGRLFCNDALQNFYSLRPTKSNKQALHV